jgi:serine/threonine protein kinase
MQQMSGMKNDRLAARAAKMKLRTLAVEEEDGAAPDSPQTLAEDFVFEAANQSDHSFCKEGDASTPRATAALLVPNAPPRSADGRPRRPSFWNSATAMSAGDPPSAQTYAMKLPFGPSRRPAAGEGTPRDTDATDSASDDSHDEGDVDFDEDDPSCIIELPAMPRADSELGGVDRRMEAIQVCTITQTDCGNWKRAPFVNAKYCILEGSCSEKFLHVQYVNGDCLKILLFGGRASDIANIGPHEEDVELLCADACLAFNPALAAPSLIFACPSPEARERLADSMCFAGCIMRDLAAKVRFFDTPSGTPDFIRRVEPISARTRTQGGVVAVKVGTNDEKTKQLMNELRFMQSLEHDAILRVHGIYEVKLNGKRGLGMLMDFKTGGDLSQWIPSSGMAETHAKEVFAQLCSGVKYLQERLIVHRDIKPSNVFCEQAADASLKAIIADFGLATRADDKERMSIACGSGGFIAPEIFRKDWVGWCTEYDPACVESKIAYERRIADILKTDVFSLGMVLYAMARGTNELIYSDRTETYRKNARGHLSRRALEELPDTLRALIRRLCEKDPRERCSILEASLHQWLN